MPSSTSPPQVNAPVAAPLLGEGVREPSRGVVRRLAAWQGPNPRVVLAVVVVTAGFACFAETVVREIQVAKASGGHVPYLPFGFASVDASEADDLLTKKAVGNNPHVSYPLVIVFGLMTVVALWASFQGAAERSLHRYLNDVAGQWGRERLGVDVDIGSIGAWVLSGRIVIRNFVLRSPRGFASDHMVLARRITVHIRPRALFHALLGGGVEAQSLTVEGVDIAIEHEGDSSSRTNLQALLSHIEQKSVGSRSGAESDVGELIPRSPKLAIGSISVSRGVVRRLAIQTTTGTKEPSGAEFANMSDRHFANPCKDFSICKNVDDVITAFVKTIVGDAESVIQGI